MTGNDNDNDKDKAKNQNKAYIEGEQIDDEIELTDEEHEALKKEKEHEGDFRRQDIFTDRRDPYKEGEYDGPERRERDEDRRKD
jgi:hypothetical protein